MKTTRKKKLKPQVTDRAKRYRAQRNVSQPSQTCIYCGAQKERLDVEHINGDEGDGRTDNLARACRPCNTTKGHTFARAGIGIRTIQNNPAHGASTLAAWRSAVDVLLGRKSGSLLSAVSTVRATPSARRVELARKARAEDNAAYQRVMKANPGALTSQQYGEAWQRIRDSGGRDMAARRLVRETPKYLRSRYNAEIWARRQERQGVVPF